MKTTRTNSVLATTIFALALLSPILSAGNCSDGTTGYCYIKDSVKVPMNCIRSKLVNPGTKTAACESSPTIEGCYSEQEQSSKAVCLGCDIKNGYLVKKRSSNNGPVTECVKCENTTHYYDTTCKVRVKSKDNCKHVDESRDVCNKCQSWFLKADETSACKAGKVTDCTQYKEGKCKSCKIGYYLKDNKCTKKDLDGCISPASDTKCQFCDKGKSNKDGKCVDAVASVDGCFIYAWVKSKEICVVCSTTALSDKIYDDSNYDGVNDYQQIKAADGSVTCKKAEGCAERSKDGCVRCHVEHGWFATDATGTEFTYNKQKKINQVCTKARDIIISRHQIIIFKFLQKKNVSGEKRDP